MHAGKNDERPTPSTTCTRLFLLKMLCQKVATFSRQNLKGILYDCFVYLLAASLRGSSAINEAVVFENDEAAVAFGNTAISHLGKIKELMGAQHFRPITTVGATEDFLRSSKA